MEQEPLNDNDDVSEMNWDPPFQIEGPDEQGEVWLVTATVRVPLGPWEPAAFAFAEWLTVMDFGERR